ncbi:Na+/melibiose symporter [Sulfobacillus thermosulfidooxidans DSM 9293]|uniref:Na+/melibiose symporter n=1 Tax=Sulfobacillus thermosulfidooxidans (strain DSM 9293 / VKM B-1269 / AT-1) TaxID=929705 RepID=A0A1W1WHT8_SULTA|nr:MFS transporter [Sulfobacillus thermosulfidooxidans]SMC05878.1 Na+/melibiose symporter [Sulfobacillus thermosulfidooxidans DSM 9293]
MPKTLQSFRSVITGPVIVLFLISFIVPFSAFMLYPFLIIYFTHVLHYHPWQAGLLLSVRFLASGIFGFTGGLVSQRLGNLRTYIISGLLSAAAIVALAFTHKPATIVMTLAILGLAASTVNAMARGLANELVKDEYRGVIQNYIHWLNNIGMAAALPLSALLLGGGYSRAPYFFAAAGYALAAGALAMTVGRSRSRSPEPALRMSQSPSSMKPWQILQHDRAFSWLLLSFALVVIVEMQFESGVPLDLSFHFAHGAKLYGVLGAIDMILVFSLQLLVAHFLDKHPNSWSGSVGMFLLSGLVIGAIWQTVLGWSIAIILLSVGDVFAFGQIFSLMGVLPKSGQHGLYFSLLGMVQGFGTFVAYALGGIGYEILHPFGMFMLTIPLTILAVFSYRNAFRLGTASQEERMITTG